MVDDVINSYINRTDWRTAENANDGRSISGLKAHVVGDVLAKHALNNMHAKDEHISGAMHIHDLRGGAFSAYCAGHDLRELLLNGLGIDSGVQSRPAKHLDVAVDHIGNYLQILSNEWEGAQAFSSIDSYLAPFVKQDNLTQREVNQQMERLVYGLNFESRQGFQSPFSSLSFDWTVQDDLNDLPCIVGGELMNYTYGDMQPYMDMINIGFLKILINGDSCGVPFTFPIPTYSVRDTSMFVDTDEKTNLLWELTAKFGSPYFSSYLGSGINPNTIRSMCPLLGSTEILVKSPKTIRNMKISTMVQYSKKNGTEYKVWSGEKWIGCKPVSIELTDVYNITLSNGTTVSMGENHLQPIRGGDVLSASELEVGMWLPFNKNEIGTELGSYELGFAMGAFAGDGSYACSGKNGLVYSLTDGKRDVFEIIKPFWESLGYEVHESTQHKENRNVDVKFARVLGNSDELVKRYIGGTDAHSKHLTHHSFNASADFKRGLIHGLKLTDGARAVNRIYTVSTQMRIDLSRIMASLGMTYSIHSFDDRKATEGGKYSDTTVYRIDFPNRGTYGMQYACDDEYRYCSIKSIEIVEMGAPLYCIEVDSDEHLFMLSSGLMTHNCRLSLNLDEIASVTGGIWNIGSKTGSLAIVSINLNRIALETSTLKEYSELLSRRVWIAHYQLMQKKQNVIDAFQSGLMPYSKKYLGRLDTFFLTVGIVGAWDAYNNMKLNISYEQFASTILETIKDELKSFSSLSEHKLWNIEQTPAEGTAYRFAKKDIELYPDCYVGGSDDDIYLTNSTHLPVDNECNIIDEINIRSHLDRMYTGGTLFNYYANESASPESVRELIHKLCLNTKLPYIAYTPTFGICTEHGITYGSDRCSVCGEPIEVYTRVVGYIRPASKFNIGQLQQFKNRKYHNTTGSD
jgi:ribonucleoside-triphosphate reductase